MQANTSDTFQEHYVSGPTIKLGKIPACIKCGKENNYQEHGFTCWECKNVWNDEHEVQDKGDNILPGGQRERPKQKGYVQNGILYLGTQSYIELCATHIASGAKCMCGGTATSHFKRNPSEGPVTWGLGWSTSHHFEFPLTGLSIISPKKFTEVEWPPWRINSAAIPLYLAMEI